MPDQAFYETNKPKLQAMARKFRVPSWNYMSYDELEQAVFSALLENLRKESRVFNNYPNWGPVTAGVVVARHATHD